MMMKSLEFCDISDTLRSELDAYCERVRQFREAGPLDSIAVAKLGEHFRASHVYHSAGIEGNRLTLQETVVVLREGVDITDKPIKDTIEVKNLGTAFDFLRTLADDNETLRESDIRQLHQLVMGGDEKASPGSYRRTGVVISGADHRPPEPLEVPALMEELLRWLRSNDDRNPIILATVAHHRLASIHPFLDGNGRVSRLLMNLILMRAGMPIANITREDRPRYYEALSYADVGLAEDLVALAYKRSSDLFNEYVRIREESERMVEWARRWGSKEASVLLRRETMELELWKSRLRQVFLEFQRSAELLNDGLEHIDVSFFDYGNEITLEKYSRLRKDGSVPQSNAFAINFFETRHLRKERFAFTYFRDFRRFPKTSNAIPLDLRYLSPSARYVSIDESPWRDSVRLRSIYFTDEGKFVARYWNVGSKSEAEDQEKTIQQWVQTFFDDVLKHVFGIS